MMLAWAAKAGVPLLSLSEAIKLVPEGRSTVQVKEVPLCWGNCLMGVWPAPVVTRCVHSCP